MFIINHLGTIFCYCTIKVFVMVIYSVRWILDKDLAKGLGKSKRGENGICFSVLCRSASDAIRCLHWYFRTVFSYQCNEKYCIDDGEIILRRSIIDSRNFTFTYLLMDKMKEPIIMSDLVHNNILRLEKIF